MRIICTLWVRVKKKHTYNTIKEIYFFLYLNDMIEMNFRS